MLAITAQVATSLKGTVQESDLPMFENALLFGVGYAGTLIGPPLNVTIFGTNELTILEMMRTGFLMNLIAVVIIVLMIYFLVPALWGLDLTSIPAAFRS